MHGAVFALVDVDNLRDLLHDQIDGARVGLILGAIDTPARSGYDLVDSLKHH